MYILSLYLSMPSTVALFKNGDLLSATHEERFTRKKNDEIFPSKSINYCLNHAKIESKDIDYVAIASYVSPYEAMAFRKSQWSVQDYIRENNLKWKPYLIEGKKLKPLSKIFKNKLKEQTILNNFIKKNKVRPSDEAWSKSIRKDLVADYLNIDKKNVFRIDHH